MAFIGWIFSGPVTTRHKVHATIHQIAIAFQIFLILSKLGEVSYIVSSCFNFICV